MFRVRDNPAAMPIAIAPGKKSGFETHWRPAA